MTERNFVKPGDVLSGRERVIVERLRSRVRDWDVGGHACKPDVSKEGVYDGHLFFCFLKKSLRVRCLCGARTSFRYRR